MWTNFDRTTDTYLILKAAIKARKDNSVWSHEHVERYIDDHFYAFTRGNVLVTVVNTGDHMERTIDHHEFKEGTELCNVIESKECVRVEGGKITIKTKNYEAKVFVPTVSQETE